MTRTQFSHLRTPRAFLSIAAIALVIACSKTSSALPKIKWEIEKNKYGTFARTDYKGLERFKIRDVRYYEDGETIKEILLRSTLKIEGILFDDKIVLHKTGHIKKYWKRGEFKACNQTIHTGRVYMDDEGQVTHCATRVPGNSKIQGITFDYGTNIEFYPNGRIRFIHVDRPMKIGGKAYPGGTLVYLDSDGGVTKSEPQG